MKSKTIHANKLPQSLTYDIGLISKVEIGPKVKQNLEIHTAFNVVVDTSNSDKLTKTT